MHFLLRRPYLAELIGLGILVLLGVLAVQRFSWMERPDPATGVALELRPLEVVASPGGRFELTATLVNNGDREVTLVEPGDGSESGWRTPIVRWSSDPWRLPPRCGNFNRPTASDVFMLRPGERRVLNPWVFCGLQWLRPGRHKVSVRYQNIPDLEEAGSWLKENELLDLQRVKESARVSIISNSVVIVVEE
jgi:hypothetical protein